MKNILAIDIGNTNITIGLYNNIQLINTFCIKSDKDCNAIDYYTLINNRLGEITPDHIAIASVVPPISSTLVQMITTYYKVPYIFITPNTPLGLTFPIPDPSHIGADIIVGVWAALQFYKTNCIVIDCGTATTIAVVGADGMFYGYAILPGPHTSAGALFAKAAQLKPFDLYNPEKLLGMHTNEAIACGVVQGHIFTIERFIEQIKEEYSGLGSFTTVLTGGGAYLLGLEVDVVNETLLLDGLAVIGMRS